MNEGASDCYERAGFRAERESVSAITRYNVPPKSLSRFLRKR